MDERPGIGLPSPAQQWGQYDGGDETAGNMHSYGGRSNRQNTVFADCH
jgi:hypothetical protein